MNVLKSKSPIIISMLIILACMVTCEVTRIDNRKVQTVQDTLLLNQWHEEKIKLISSYEHKLLQLRKAQDSLKAQVIEKKAQFMTARRKTSVLEERLRKQVISVDTGNAKCSTVLPLVDSLTFSSDQGNKLCDETVLELESELASKDSSMSAYTVIHSNLVALQTEQSLKMQALTEQMEVGNKTERRLIIKNKLLAAGMLLLSGLASSLLLIQTIK